MADGPDLAGARARVEGRVWRTPALHVDALDEACGREIWLKPECLQRTGSFKFRGATNAVARLPDGTAGVVCISSGNHAQAVARAAREAGIALPRRDADRLEPLEDRSDRRATAPRSSATA